LEKGGDRRNLSGYTCIESAPIVVRSQKLKKEKEV